MKNIFVVIIILLIGGWFYWYEVRPSQIKKECSEELKINGGVTFGEDNRSEKAQIRYEKCIHSKGL